MTPTLALTAALLLSPVGVHSTTPDTSSSSSTVDTATDGVEQCELFGHRGYAHRVTMGAMDAGMWNDLISVGWSVGFVNGTSPVLVSPNCEA